MSKVNELVLKEAMQAEAEVCYKKDNERNDDQDCDCGRQLELELGESLMVP